MDTTRKVLPEFKLDTVSRQERLADAWRNIVNGSGSREDADLVMADLAKESEYFMIAAPDADGAALMRREGKRELMARILFLLDLPFAYMTELRRAATDEQQVDLLRGEA